MLDALPKAREIKYLVVSKRSGRLDMTLVEEKDFSRLDEYINTPSIILTCYIQKDYNMVF